MNRRNFIKGMMAAAVVPMCPTPIDPPPEPKEKTATEIANKYEHGSVTNFAALTPEQKAMWSNQIWRQAREQSFFHRLT